MPIPAAAGAPAGEAATGGEAASTAEAGAASLEDMAALMADSGSADGGEGVPAEETPTEGAPAADPEGEKPAEKPKEEPAPAAEDTPDALKLRKGFAALARDRQKMHEREAAADAAIAEAKQHTEKAQRHDSLLARLKESPHEVIKEVGGDALVTSMLKAIAAEEKSPAEREVDRLRDEWAKDKAATKQREEQAAVMQFHQGVHSAVAAAGEKYDLVNTLAAVLPTREACVEIIQQYYNKFNGAVISADIAAEALETGLKKALSGSKTFGPREAVKPPAATPAKPKATTNGTTLTSVASGDHPPPANGYPLDDDQRFEAVMKELGAANLL